MGSKRLVLPVRLNYDDEARRWYVMSAPVCGVSSVVAECYSRSDADAVIAALNSSAPGAGYDRTMQAHADIEADSTTPLRGLRVGDGARSRHLRNDAGELIAKCGSHRTAILIVAAVAERDRLAAQIRESRAAAYRGCAAELRDKAEKLRKRTADTGAWEWAARLLEGYADRWEGRALSRSLAAGPAQPGEEEK